MKKTLTLSLTILFTLAAIYGVVRFIKMDSFSFAWILNFLLMSSMILTTGALKSQLTSSYFEEKAWEQKGKIYEYLGINIFKKFLVLIGWEKVFKYTYPIKTQSEALKNLYYQTKKSELDHLIIFIIVLGFNVFVAVKFGFVKSLSLLILNLVFNLYPIFLQRYNRPRIKKALMLSERRSAASI
ncbi:hypothetical protein FPZ43_08955 [Mucilaginibacter pallidiroseus]|uniref:Glycosyl-4,4'-diaponeurosporenoate acyltransferase n=1 Tax=Mucilaginibacter pallidiroseus TaxID=2599295 RepID=A0A563UF89_9SPHI|nr:hypothetical protein [Mucilaginibacter pallidiroseus]TWR29966.1 hypothetical protein FPZ43_08955 [Mucilaginibacter pallidiroseus]